MSALGTLISEATTKLQEANIDNPRREAQLLACHFFDVDMAKVLGRPDLEVPKDTIPSFDQAVHRRANREPISHIFGEKEFWGLAFKVNKHTLTPRPDSETLIEAVLERIEDKTEKLRILDLGTGTGCLLLSLLSEFPHASGVGVDLSEEALLVAIENAQSLGLEGRATFKQGSWFEGATGEFNIIISNPPYIPKADKANLEPEVADHEPHMALFGGEDGLDCYKEIPEQAIQFLKPNGLLVFEVGIHQALDVSGLLQKNGYSQIGIKKDLSGIERCVSGSQDPK
ncbi:MAG: peptide chain release factor N(5)-glutamine methyltransferase [Rhodospirillales bacterium]|nr:peptide chain release factor N(5)-glutamine methyltransferase [Rhodospirillales bacterium]